MLADGVGHDFPKDIDSNDIGEEEVGNGEGYQQEDGMFEAFFYVFGSGVRPVVQLFLLGPIALDQKFYPAENEFHEDGLRTRPATPHAPVHSGKQDDAYQCYQHPEYEDVQILRPKDVAKQHELTFDDIKEQEWFTADLDKRGCKKECEEPVSYHLTAVEPFSFRFLCIHPFAFRFYVNCCHSFLFTLNADDRDLTDAHGL